MEKFCIFDLDGTLIDTLEGIKEALNETLKELNIPINYSKDEVKTFIGGGVKRLFLLALKRPYKEEELKLMLENYHKYQFISKPFPNVIDTLEHLKNNGIKLFIFSNKPNQLLIELIDYVFPKDLFIEVKGSSDEFKNKPDPEYINYLIKKYDLNINDGFYVGDSEYDYLTAINSSLKSIIYLHGYGDYKKIKNEKNIYKFISDFKELEDII